VDVHDGRRGIANSHTSTDADTYAITQPVSVAHAEPIADTDAERVPFPFAFPVAEPDSVSYTEPESVPVALAEPISVARPRGPLANGGKRRHQSRRLRPTP
jgi:hypothetical protein